MRSSLFLSLLALLLSLVVLGAVLLIDEPVERSGPESTLLVPASEDIDVEARLHTLEEENRALRDRIAMLEQQPAQPDSAAEDLATRNELGLLGEQVAGLWQELEELRTQIQSRTGGGAAAAAPTELEGQVAEALETIRRDERLAKAAAELEKSSANLEPRLDAWSDWLRLDDYQRIRLSEIMTERDEREREVLEAWKSGSDPDRIAAKREEIERGFLRSVRSLLSPEQAETMNEKFGDERGPKGR